MNCPKFMALSEQEQKELWGELIHSVQNDDVCFMAALEIIELARERGRFDGVKIGHEAINVNDDLAEK